MYERIINNNTEYFVEAISLLMCCFILRIRSQQGHLIPFHSILKTALQACLQSKDNAICYGVYHRQYCSDIIFYDPMSSIVSSAIVSLNVYLLCNRILECFEANFLEIWPRLFSLAL